MMGSSVGSVAGSVCAGRLMAPGRMYCTHKRSSSKVKDRISKIVAITARSIPSKHVTYVTIRAPHVDNNEVFAGGLVRVPSGELIDAD